MLLYSKVVKNSFLWLSIPVYLPLVPTNFTLVISRDKQVFFLYTCGLSNNVVISITTLPISLVFAKGHDYTMKIFF
jgi:hypothetical protein